MSKKRFLTYQNFEKEFKNAYVSKNFETLEEDKIFRDSLQPDSLVDKHYQKIDQAGLYRVPEFICSLNYRSLFEKRIIAFSMNLEKTAIIENEQKELNKAKKNGGKFPGAEKILEF